MKKLLLITTLFFGIAAHSQTITDTATLRSYINANIVPNGTKSITAQMLNRIMNGYLNSWPNNRINLAGGSPFTWNSGTRTLGITGWNATNWNTTYNWYQNGTITINGTTKYISLNPNFTVAGGTQDTSSWTGLMTRNHYYRAWDSILTLHPFQFVGGDAYGIGTLSSISVLVFGLNSSRLPGSPGPGTLGRLYYKSDYTNANGGHWGWDSTDYATTLYVNSNFGAFLQKSSNLSDLTNAGTARTNLGGTTVGKNLFTATNPSAVRWIRVNADNSISFRTAAETLSDIGGGTGSTDSFHLYVQWPIKKLNDSTLYMDKADATHDGYLDSADWAGFDSVHTAYVNGTIVKATTTQTLTNKRWVARVGSTTSSATPTINTDNVDIYKLTAQAADITSFTTNLSGTPNDGDILEIQITGTAARAITWGTSFVSSTVTLPTTTVTTATLTIIFQYYTTSSYGNNKWTCVNSY